MSRQNGRLELVTGDAVSAYYNDFETASGGPKLMQATISAMLPYTVTATSPAFTFTGEQRYTTSGSSWLEYPLPFTFPFFDKKYGSVKVFANGLLAFDIPSTVSSCTDGIALMRYPAVYSPLDVCACYVQSPALRKPARASTSAPNYRFGHLPLGRRVRRP